MKKGNILEILDAQDVWLIKKGKYSLGVSHGMMDGWQAAATELKVLCHFRHSLNFKDTLRTTFALLVQL